MQSYSKPPSRNPISTGTKPAKITPAEAHKTANLASQQGRAPHQPGKAVAGFAGNGVKPGKLTV